MANPNEIIDPQTQENLKNQQAEADERASKNFNVGGGGAAGELDTGTFGQTYTPAPPNTNIAYSGSDCKAFIVTYGQVAKDSFIPLKNLSAISYSIHRDKAPVRSLGHYVATDYTKGTRTVAGSIVIVNFDRAAFFELVSGVDIYGAAGKNIEVADNIPAFDIMLAFSEENKGRHSSLWTNGAIGPPKPDKAADFSYMWIRNVHFVDEGSVTGTEEAYLETTFQYVAEHVEYLTPNNVNIGTSPVANIASTVGGSPSTTPYTRALPHRHYEDQRDELANWDTGQKQMDLVFDRDEVGQFNASFDYSISSESNADAIKTAGSDPHEWVRPDTNLIFVDADVPTHLLGAMSSINDLTVTGTPQGTGAEHVNIEFESFHPDADITNNNIIHITNAHLFHDYDRNCWQKLWGLEKPPVFGNKFQNDLHNVAKAKYEEFEETLVYDGAVMTPGVVDFTLTGEVDNGAIVGFSNDVDDHFKAISSVKEHSVVLSAGLNPGDPGIASVTIDEADVQETLTETFEIDLEPLIDQYTISRSYINNGFDRIDVDVWINQTDLQPSSLGTGAAMMPNRADLEDLQGSTTGPDINQLQFKWFEFYSTPQVAPDHCDNAGYADAVTCGAAGAAWVTGAQTTGKFTISVPPTPLIDKQVSSTRSGPGILGANKQFQADKTTAGEDVIATSLVTSGPSVNRDQVVLQVDSPTGMDLSGFFTLSKHEDVVDSEGVLVSTDIEISGYAQAIPGSDLHLVPPTSVTTEYTQNIGTYTYTSTSDIQDFAFVPPADTHQISSFDQLDWDWTDTTYFHTDLLPNIGYSHNHQVGSNNFQISGARQWTYKSVTKQLSGFTSQFAVLTDTVPLVSFYQDKYQFKSQGQNNSVYVRIKTQDGIDVAQGLMPISWDASGAVVNLSSFGVPSTGGIFTITDFNTAPWQSYQAYSVEIQYEYKYVGDIPIGIQYTAVDPTPLSVTATLDNNGADTASARVIDESSIEVIVVQSDGTSNTSFTTVFDADTNQLTINDLNSHLISDIRIDYLFEYIGLFPTTVHYFSFADNSFADTVILDLGQDEPINFNKEQDVSLSCADSSAQIEPTPFGIVIGDPILNTTTNNWEVTVSEIPGMVIHDSHDGWLASLWNGIFGDPGMPEGNILININYKVWDSTTADQQVQITYDGLKDNQTGTWASHDQVAGTAPLNGFTVSKTYEADKYEKIQIINPGLYTETQGTCDCSNAPDPNACPPASPPQNSFDCAAGGGIWVAGSGPPAHTPHDVTGYQQNVTHAMNITEITDYGNLSSPPTVSFNVDGVLGIIPAKNILDTGYFAGNYKVTFDLTYDVQTGELPIVFTYLRKTGDTYPAIDSTVNFGFEASVPIFTHDPTANLDVTLDIIEKVYFCGNDGALPAEDCRNAPVDPAPVEVEAIVPVHDTNGEACTTIDPNDPTKNTPSGCNPNYGAIIGPDTLNVSNPLQAYTLLKDPNTTSGSPFTIEFPTGINPLPDAQGVHQPLNKAAAPTYKIDVDYKKLVSYNPPSVYDTPGYLLTAILNVTNFDTFKLVLDIDNNSLNYYRGLGVCEDTQYTVIDECIENDLVWTEDPSEDIALCEAVGGTYVMESPLLEDEIIQGILKPAGVCQLSTNSIDSLIADQKFVQFSFMLVGPGTTGQTDSGKNIYKIFESSENFNTLDKAVEAMQRQYEEEFGK